MLDRGRRWTGLPIAALLASILASGLEAPAVAAAAIPGPWRVCDGPPWDPQAACVPNALRDVDPQGRLMWLTAEVRIDRKTAEPMAVFISAYASSAVYWDGRLVGRNGNPAARPERERAGLRDAVLALPDSAPGPHRLAIQMSSHKGLVRLRSPITQVSVAPFERASTTKMRDYLPALISAGALLIMVMVFAFLCAGRRRTPGSRYLLGAALLATGQLGAEASRAFLEYPYPMHFLRIGLVLACAAGFGFMLLAYLARRFDLPRLQPILAAQALAAVAALILVRNFDQRTGLVLSSAMGIGLLLAIRAATRTAAGAVPLAAMLSLGLLLSLAEPHRFLDRDLYLWTAGLFLLLFAGEARRMKSDLLREVTASAPRISEPSAPGGLWLGAALQRQFVMPADIVRVAAADDYCEVFLGDGRAVLHPEPLQTLVEGLPEILIRIHRSHAINLSHLRSFRKGAHSSVLLSDQSVAPVSRRKVSALLAALDG